jgi:CysZ protein
MNALEPRFVEGLLRGLHSAVRGITSALRVPSVRRTYWQVVGILLAASLVLAGLGGWAAIAVSRPSPDATGIMAAAFIALRVVLLVAAVAGAPIVAFVAVNALVPAFGDRLFFAGLAAADPARAAALEARVGLSTGRAILIGLRRLLRLLLLVPLAFALGLVPLVGPPLSAATELWILASSLAWELLEPYFTRCGATHARQREYLRTHRAMVLGFALPCVVMMAVPFVGAFFFGLAQAAAGRLVADIGARPEDGWP